MDILNAEFERLLVSSGWKQSEAARHLELSPAVVTRYLNNDTRPSLTVLKLFKLLIGDMHPLPGQAGAPDLDDPLELPLDPAERRLLGQLRALPVPERRRVIQGFCGVVGVLSSPGRIDGKVNGRSAKRKDA